MFRKCESCKQYVAPHQFVHDPHTDDWICTLCGGVVKKWMYSNDNSHFDNAPPLALPQSGAQKKTAEQGERLLERFFPAEKRKKKMHAKLKHFGELLDVSESVLNRAGAQLTKFPKILETIRPIDHAIVASIVIAKRSNSEYVNIKTICELLGWPDIGKVVIDVCNIMGLSQRSDPLHNINRLVYGLGLPYNTRKKIIKLYNYAQRSNGSIGSDTLMTLVLIRFFHANRKKSKLPPKMCKLGYFASLTNTSESSLRGYIDGTGGKCDLFHDKNRKKFLYLF